MAHLAIIVGSTREGRFSETLISWIESAVKALPDTTFDLIDLRDHPLPFYDRPESPSSIENGEYAIQEARELAKLIKAADGFVVISPEYNHGYSAVLKNTFDWIYAEWNKKAIGFISYGSVGGGRAVEQLRQVAVELQMAPIRNAVHIMSPWNLRESSGALKDGVLDDYVGARDKMLTQLLWWTNALKTARG